MKNYSDIHIFVQRSCLHLLVCREAIEGISQMSSEKNYRTIFHNISSEEAAGFDYSSLSAEGGPVGDGTKVKVLVLGFTDNWVKVCTEMLVNAGAHVILVNTSSLPLSKDVSYINQDRGSAIIKCIDYLADAGRTKPALIGVNQFAFADIQKKEAFLRYKIRKRNLNFFKEKSIVVQEEKENEESGVFSSKGSIEGCCNEFLEIFCQKSTGNKDNYDSAICVNDMVAAIFLKKASERGVRVPEDLHVSGYGNSTICRFTKPPLTTIDLNYRKAGENAVAIFNMLGMMTGIISLSTVIESRIYVRGSTGCHPVAGHNEKTGETCAAEKLQFINDPDVVELYKIEKILNHCDELDLKIIDGILAGKGKENIAESIPIGVSTFRYRMAKLLAGVGLKSRKELSELLCKYGITNTYI